MNDDDTPQFDDPAFTSSERVAPPAKPRSKRHNNRIAAMQFLYMCEANEPDSLPSAMRLFFSNLENERDYYAFGEELAEGAWENRETVDATITKYAQNWSFARIAKVDLAILRLALYELLFRRDIPPIVSINEAIDLSKNFSGPDSKRFINGILDHAKGQLDRPLRTAAE